MPVPVPVNKKIGFDQREMKRLYHLLRPHFACECEIPEELQSIHSPLVICCNHYEAFGPLAVVESLPLRFHVWMNREILHPLENENELLPGIQRCMPNIRKETVKAVYERACPLAERAFGALQPIASSYNQPLGLTEALRTSVEYLEQGDSIVVFPETGQPHYADGGVTDFFLGFALMGELYWKKTGKDVLFCPLYVDRWEREMVFGHPVAYPPLPTVEACGCISQEMHDQLWDMAVMRGHVSLEDDLNEEIKRLEGGKHHD